MVLNGSTLGLPPVVIALPGLGNLTARLSKVQLSGLDTFSKLEFWGYAVKENLQHEKLSPFELRDRVNIETYLDELNVTLGFDLDMAATTGRKSSVHLETQLSLKDLARGHATKSSRMCCGGVGGESGGVAGGEAPHPP